KYSREIRNIYERKKVLPDNEKSPITTTDKNEINIPPSNENPKINDKINELNSDEKIIFSNNERLSEGKQININININEKKNTNRYTDQNNNKNTLPLDIPNKNILLTEDGLYDKEVKNIIMEMLLNSIKKPLKVDAFKELREREELHTALWHSIFRNIDTSTNDLKTLQEYKTKLIKNSAFLDMLRLHNPTVHQSLYSWNYGNQFNSFGELIQSFHGKGNVICTGDNHFQYAISTIDILRHVHNCTLPIEVFYSDSKDLSRENQKLLSEFKDVYVSDLSEYFNNDIINEKGYLEKGIVFFRDRTLHPGSHIGSQCTVVIHKIKTILGLLNVCKLNELEYRRNVIYKMVYGDKETFWMGFDMARQSYYMNPIPKDNIKLINFNAYYIDDGHGSWSPKLDCVKAYKKDTI
ncbi:glycosyltransferase family 71 protein, partial [Piromyces sp. E2]